MRLDEPYIQRLHDNVFVIHIPKAVTDKQIDEVTKKIIPVVIAQQEGVYCAISGYDSDERELYQIPEVTTLCQRLVDRGFISILATSTLMEKEEKPWARGFFGAMEIWAIANGHLTHAGDLTIEPTIFQRFLDSLTLANATARKLEPRARDGQHRTRVSFN